MFKRATTLRIPPKPLMYIAFVCALLKQSALVVSSWITSKIQIFRLQKSFYSECIFPEGVSPLYAGVTLRSISKSSRRVGRATHALKEARLQSPLLTNRNGIWGYWTRISKHIIVTSKEYKHRFVVDAAGIGGREKLLPGDTLTTTGLVKSRSQHLPAELW